MNVFVFQGGVFAGDDYFNGFVPQAGYTFGVRDAVDEFFGTKNYRVQATGYAFPKEGVFQQVSESCRFCFIRCSYFQENCFATNG